MQCYQLCTAHSWYKGMSGQIWNVLYIEVSSILSFNLEIQIGWPRTTYQLVLVDANLDGPILKRAYDKQIPTCSLKFLHLFSSKFAWQLIYAGLSSLGEPGVPWHTQILADQLTLFQTGGTDYAHLIITGTPGFSDLTTALNYSWLLLLELFRSKRIHT